VFGARDHDGAMVSRQVFSARSHSEIPGEAKADSRQTRSDARGSRCARSETRVTLAVGPAGREPPFRGVPDASVNSTFAAIRSVRRAGAVDETQKLRAGAGVIAEHAEHPARHHLHASLVYAARGHALV
jgi:hypothetical protein